jgi:hypothetical protein
MSAGGGQSLPMVHRVSNYADIMVFRLENPLGGRFGKLYNGLMVLFMKRLRSVGLGRSKPSCGLIELDVYLRATPHRF